MFLYSVNSTTSVLLVYDELVRRSYRRAEKVIDRSLTLVTTLFAVRLSALGEISRWLDPTALGIVASAVAFALVFVVRRGARSS